MNARHCHWFDSPFSPEPTPQTPISGLLQTLPWQIRRQPRVRHHHRHDHRRLRRGLRFEYGMHYFQLPPEIGILLRRVSPLQRWIRARVVHLVLGECLVSQSVLIDDLVTHAIHFLGGYAPVVAVHLLQTPNLLRSVVCASPLSHTIVRSA